MNARLEVYPGVFRAEQPAVSEGEWNDAVANQLQSMSIDDFLGELDDDLLKAAMNTGDRMIVGEMMFAVKLAYAERCADQELFGQSWRQTTREAAARVLLERSGRAV
jgi:hypothetical protein